MNNSTECWFSGDGFLVLPYIGLAIFCLVTCESLMTIITIIRSPALHENQYLFIVSLAVMDILLSVAILIAESVYFPWMRLYFSSIVMGAITVGVSTATMSVTGVHMSIIAIDRYIRIAHPFYYINKMTKKRVFQILICAWTAWLLMVCILLVATSVPDYLSCAVKPPKMEYTFSIVAITFVNVGVVSVCYFKIARLAVSHKNAAIARRHQNGVNRDMTALCSNNITLKCIKFFMTMFGVYFVCVVTPFIVTVVQIVYNFSKVVIYFLGYSFPAHSVLNFFILCLMDKRFSRALKTTFRLCCFRRKYI